MSIALATSSDSGTPYSGFGRPMRNPLLQSPDKVQRVPKEPGSKKLVHGKWVVVKPDDDDASDRCAHGVAWSEPCVSCHRAPRRSQ